MLLLYSNVMKNPAPSVDFQCDNSKMAHFLGLITRNKVTMMTTTMIAIIIIIRLHIQN